jgi:hypothetical protein
VVECDLAKVEVAGSNPVSRSSFSGIQILRAPQMEPIREHSWICFRGAVPKW